MHLYDKIDLLCKRKGIDVPTAYNDMKINKGTVSTWKTKALNGEDAVPSARNAIKLAEYFGMSTEFFLHPEIEDIDENKKTPTPEGERDYQSMIEAFENADESTREAILLLLKLK